MLRRRLWRCFTKPLSLVVCICKHLPTCLSVAFINYKESGNNKAKNVSTLKKRNNMQNVVKVLADTLLVDLFNKNSKGADISKSEFDVMMEAYKKDHENRIDSSNQLEPEQKEKLKQLYNKVADNIKDYCQECLRIDGRLID